MFGTISLAMETACAASSGVHIDAVNWKKQALFSIDVKLDTDGGTYHEVWFMFLYHGSHAVYAWLDGLALRSLLCLAIGKKIAYWSYWQHNQCDAWLSSLRPVCHIASLLVQERC